MYRPTVDVSSSILQATVKQFTHINFHDYCDFFLWFMFGCIIQNESLFKANHIEVVRQLLMIENDP